MTEDLIQRLCADTLMFRNSVDSLLSSQCREPAAFCERIHEVWMVTARLYLDQIEVSRCTITCKNAPLDTGEHHSVAKGSENPVEVEHRIRTRLRTYLEQLTIWSRFDLRNAIPVSRGLKSKENYIDALALHLPEIYVETIRLERYARTFLAHPSATVLSQAIVSAEHLGKNHISFALPALEWLTDYDAWI